MKKKLYIINKKKTPKYSQKKILHNISSQKKTKKITSQNHLYYNYPNKLKKKNQKID